MKRATTAARRAHSLDGRDDGATPRHRPQLTSSTVISGHGWSMHADSS